jgi:ABC-type maltose transport system permease subunit
LLKSNSAAAAFIIPTSVLIQALFRCGFVLLYHRVEVVIQKSIEHHERSELVNEGDEGNLHSVDQSGNELSQTARLRLEINDFSCGLAAGLGYGGMHTIMLYGTLLASETDRWGTLYQTSCSFIPSLANAAIIAFFFFFLDLAWMILTFYGMRRLNFTSDSHQSRTSLSGAIGGTSALLSVVILHIAASCVTLINELRVDGCKVSLPILGVIVGITYVFLRIFIWDSYLPEGIRRI